MNPYDHQFVADEEMALESLLARKEELDAFNELVARLDRTDDRYFPELFGVLSWLQDKRSLVWIERNINRCVGIGLAWGHLASSSKITWERSRKWLAAGRPLSLVSLDVIMYHTTQGPRLNQSPLMRNLNPRFGGSVSVAEIAREVIDYEKKDPAARVRMRKNQIFASIFTPKQG